MKKLLAIALVLMLGLALPSWGQFTVTYVYQSPATINNTVTANPGLRIIGTGAQFHQLVWNVSGVVSTCQIEVDSSADGVSWNVADIIASTLCTSNGSVLSSVHVVNFVRINVTTFTGTGFVTALLTGYANNPSGGGGLPAGLTFVAPTLTVSTAGSGNGALALSGNTSGTCTFTDSATSTTVTESCPLISALGGNTVMLGSAANNGLASSSNETTFIEGGTNTAAVLGAAYVMQAGGEFCWSSGTNSLGGCDTGSSRIAQNNISFGNGVGGDETANLRWNSCRVSTDITLTANTAITVCTWALPGVAKTWAWQCKIPWVISAGTGTNTLAILATPSQTPTGTTNGSAEIKTSNTNTATEAVTPISTSGATTLLTSGTITPAATVFQSSTSGTLLASGTAGTFAIQMTAAGTTVTAAAKAGATCILY